MHSIADIPISDLLLDVTNPRLAVEPANQSAVALALAEQQRRKLLRLAEDIVKHGVDPTALPAVVPNDEDTDRFIVVEGNRRVLALKALDTPSLVLPALQSRDVKHLNRLSDEYVDNPITSIPCAIFPDREDTQHWIELRHTGENQGAGIVAWGSAERDRFAHRHGTRSAALQLIELVEKHGSISTEARTSTIPIHTNVQRLLSTPEVRHRLGLELEGGILYTRYPTSEVVKGLSKLVDDLRTQYVKVKDIYTADDRREYIKGFDPSDLADTAMISDIRTSLDDLTTRADPSNRKDSRYKRPPRPPRPRTTLVPASCDLKVTVNRIALIYAELQTISLVKYPNAVAILLRVFLELSVDNYVCGAQLLTEEEMRSTSLAKRIKTTARALQQKGIVSRSLKLTLERVSDSSRLLVPSAITFNQYVHNPFTIPTPEELRYCWDELQPFFELLWPSDIAQ